MSKKIKPIVLDKVFVPLNEKQTLIKDSFASKHQILIGSAGTGKSFSALNLALELVLDKQSNYNKIIIVRASVPSRSIGFLKGTLEEKIAVYEAPYSAIVNDLTKRMPIVEQEMFDSNYEKAKYLGVIEFINTSYLRGITMSNAIIIFDECQSASFHELDSLLTRLGEDSKLVLCGDSAQNDLKIGESGLGKMLKIINHMKTNFNIIDFKTSDIVRSGFVKDYLVTKELLEAQNEK